MENTYVLSNLIGMAFLVAGVVSVFFGIYIILVRPHDLKDGDE